MRYSRLLTADPSDAIESAGALGFDAVILSAPPAENPGLPWIADVEIDRFAIDDPLVKAHPSAFSMRREWRGDGPIDPRLPAPAVGEARARLRDAEAARLLLPEIIARLNRLVATGAAGLRLLRPDAADPDRLAELIAQLKSDWPDLFLIAQTPGLTREAASRLRGLDALVGSFAYWDGRSPWLAEEYEALRMTAPILCEVTTAAARRAGEPGQAHLLRLAALCGHGLIVPAALAGQGGEPVREAHSLVEAAAQFAGEMRLIPAGNRATAIIRADAPDLRDCREAMLVLANGSEAEATLPHGHEILAAAGADFAPFERRRSPLPPFAPLDAGEVRLLFAKRARPIVVGRTGKAAAARKAAALPRLVIETLRPDVDRGRFAIKRTVGDVVEVEAVFFGDGHEQLAAELRWRALDESEWRSARMVERGNDRWTACFTLDRLGPHEFVVVGWLARFGTFRRDFRKKLDAGVGQPVDFQEGRALIEKASRKSERLQAFLGDLDVAPDEASAAAILLDPELQLLMDDADDRPFALASAPRRVDAERIAARFSSWYELFPRSQTDDPRRHGRFDDVIPRLPQIRAMGFDTLYFPPIHPIGQKHRKGRNNSLDPGPDDPGSPYAIGSEEGGHDAVHPELGTLEDFRRLVAAARGHGLEIALDFAIQCSPDHPWLKDHPGWFDWRPDGTIKYAENPPKKYQDIVNVDFWKDEAIPGLWIALRDIVLFWIRQGVKVFRVDNPHTKPFPFWEWMIADIRGVHPDVIFLSEAFTRPAVMYRLAKIGFSQSYTYFTWRNGKRELTDYLTELTTTEVAEYFRPHFFVNTPDINPTFLHHSGRAGFRIRAVLAATLSGLFGVYSGFELCEAEPVPGKEEYWESEKYEIKPRDWQAPGNIIEDIARLNRLRRAYPALQTHLGVEFYNAWNDQILYYGKRAPGGSDMILVAVSLDPHNAQECDFEIPLWEFGLADHESLAVEDLVHDSRFTWTGKVQHMHLDPDQPYAIWRVSPPGIEG